MLPWLPSLRLMLMPAQWTAQLSEQGFASSCVVGCGFYMCDSKPAWQPARFT